MQRCSLPACGNPRESRSSFCLTHQVGSYKTAHRRVYRRHGRAADHACVDCGGPALEWSYRGGAPDERTDQRNGTYSMNPNFYEARCHQCHKQFDARNLTPA